MTLQELAHQENILYSNAIDISNRPQTDELKKSLQQTHIKYRETHQCYADLSFRDIEALKRGLFIQWYALVEPYWLTGINGLNEDAENEIMNSLNEIIRLEKYDLEKIWMLNYYWSIADWPFTGLKAFKFFDQKIINEQNRNLPDRIDRSQMENRGQMGKYWNSLTRFTSP